MNKKTIRTLEFNKIVNQLMEEAVSEIGKEKIKAMEVSTNFYEIKEKLKETSEASGIIMKRGNIPISHIYDIMGAAKRAEMGGVLSPHSLIEISYNLKMAARIKTFLREDLEANLNIEGLVAGLFQDRNITDEIDRCIISEEEIADNASSMLRTIRRTIRNKNESIKTKLNSIVSSANNSKMLQDAIITIRQGRYVVPVKQAYRGNFPGIVHDQSSTGATLFIEPMSIVNLNNELKELKLKEEAEIERILQELSLFVGNVGAYIRNNQEILATLDYIFAKGRLSVKMNGIEPIINEKGNINIRNGRHPMILPKEVVPTSINLGKSFDTLVITGPNTGGKTVTLKTVGLFVLMTQAGLHIPADFGTELSIYKKIYADIGDEQSIEQNLSTFSSHMTNIVDILKNVDDETLVLLDELGAGTDPTEGAALAISILKYLHDYKVKTMATTHYTEIKKYALSTDGVENASMEFDIKTLSPTYRLIIGTPGKSNAFEISKKLGLQDFIIDEARSLLSSGDIVFEDILSQIERDKIAAENERDEAIQLKMNIKKQDDAIKERQHKLDEQRKKIVDEARAEAKRILKGAKTMADDLSKELRDLAKNMSPSETNKKLEKAKTDLRQELSKLNISDDVKEVVKHVPPKKLKKGDTVKVVTLDQIGTVINLPDKNDDVRVQIGLMKVNVNRRNLMLMEDPEKKESGKTALRQIYRSKASDISVSCDVRGEMLEEAEMHVEKYLDDAYIVGLKEVTIIHGKGEGILRSGIQDLLKRNKNVKSYRTGDYGEGGAGVTMVSLK